MEETPIEASANVQAVPASPAVDPEKVKARIADLEFQQNFTLGIIAGIVAGIVGACIWAGITVATEHQIGWMAIGEGFLVGISMRYVGKGISMRFGIAGAAIALMGCALGNVLSACGFVAQVAKDMTFWDVLGAMLKKPSLGVDLFTSMFSQIDLLFYGFALYAGYQYSWRKVSEEDVAKMVLAGK